MGVQTVIFLKVLVSMLLGSIIGYDRERARKAAGLRTHMCVAGASTFFVSIGVPLVDYFQVDIAAGAMQTDPIRIIEATITGVAFLGAGTIIKSQNESVHGLTTAASLLLTAAVGLAVALDLYLLSVGVAVSTLVILSPIGSFYRRMSEKRKK